MIAINRTQLLWDFDGTCVERESINFACRCSGTWALMKAQRNGGIRLKATQVKIQTHPIQAVSVPVPVATPALM